ncbi:MAG: hypothetical protein WCF77_05380 [Minisyncoccia bacterium]
MPDSSKTVRVLGEIKLANLADSATTLTLSVLAGKGTEEEPMALAAVEVLITNLNRRGVHCERFFRNTPTGDRPDGVRIFF